MNDGNTMNTVGWDSLIQESLEYLRAQQDRLRRDFDLSLWQRYDYDQEAGTISFSTDGVIGVVADIHVVGSTSKRGGTWLWSWANPSVLEKVKHCMPRVRDFGTERGFTKLTEAKWVGDEYDGWEMTAIAAKILDAEGAYRSPGDGGALFMTLKNVRRPGN